VIISSIRGVGQAGDFLETFAVDTRQDAGIYETWLAHLRGQKLQNITKKNWLNRHLSQADYGCCHQDI
jgi:hypothetical protein